MKAKLETIPVKGRGVELESETEEESKILENIWNTHGGLATLSRGEFAEGKNAREMVKLVVAPNVEENEKEEI